MEHEKIMVGRQEWCSLPNLNIVRMPAKIDTGAKTSALHAEDIHIFERDGMSYVRFKVNPLVGEVDTKKQCEELVVDIRSISSSNSAKETRYIINTDLVIGKVTHRIELSLTNRNLMRFNLLLGREALRKFAIIDPSKKYILGFIGE